VVEGREEGNKRFGKESMGIKADEGRKKLDGKCGPRVVWNVRVR